MQAPAEDVDHRKREDGLPAGQMPPERQPARRCSCTGRRDGDREQGVRAEPLLPGGAVERDQRRVQPGLVERVSSCHGRPDLLAYVSDRTAHAQAAEAHLVSITKLERLMPAGRGAGRDARATERATVETDISLDSGPAARVEDLARGDRFDPCSGCHPAAAVSTASNRSAVSSGGSVSSCRPSDRARVRSSTVDIRPATCRRRGRSSGSRPGRKRRWCPERAGRAPRRRTRSRRPGHRPDSRRWCRAGAEP